MINPIEKLAERVAGYAMPLLFLVSLAVFLSLSVMGLWSIACYWGWP